MTTEPTTTPTRRHWPWIAGIVAALLVGFLLGTTTTEDVESAAETSEEPSLLEQMADEVADSAAARDDEPEPEPEPESEPEPEFAVPTADDITLDVKVLEQKCFGSAGCNVTFRVEAGWVDEFDPDVTYEVTYEVRGGEDLLINTMEIEGDYYSTRDSERIGTSSADDELTAVVTSISERP